MVDHAIGAAYLARMIAERARIERRRGVPVRAAARHRQARHPEAGPHLSEADRQDDRSGDRRAGRARAPRGDRRTGAPAMEAARARSTSPCCTITTTRPHANTCRPAAVVYAANLLAHRFGFGCPPLADRRAGRPGRQRTRARRGVAGGSGGPRAGSRRGRRGASCPDAGAAQRASRISRTFRTSVSSENGFCRKASLGEHSRIADGLVGVPRHVDHLHVGARRQQPLGEGRPAHLRHHDVGDQQVDRSGRLRRRRERLVAVGGRQHDVPVPRQPLAQEIAHPVLVLDQQQRLASARRRRRGSAAVRASTTSTASATRGR